jgi:putative ABC transport system ATP-binding protein
MSILEAKNLKKVYGKGENRVHALDGVDLAVNKGEFLAIVGTS